MTFWHTEPTAYSFSCGRIILLKLFFFFFAGKNLISGNAHFFASCYFATIVLTRQNSNTIFDIKHICGVTFVCTRCDIARN